MNRITFRKIWTSVLMLVVLFVSSVPVNAAEFNDDMPEVKTVEIDLNNVVDENMVAKEGNQSKMKLMTKDFAMSTGQTGIIYSAGQNVDFSRIIPSGSVIDSITIYTDTSTKVTHSKFTTINNYEIMSYESGKKAVVPFKRTDNPSSTSTTTKFVGEKANVRFYVRIQGRIISQYTGMDGFTVFGGYMIVTYH